MDNVTYFAAWVSRAWGGPDPARWIRRGSPFPGPARTAGSTRPGTESSRSPCPWPRKRPWRLRASSAPESADWKTERRNKWVDVTTATLLPPLQRIYKACESYMLKLSSYRGNCVSFWTLVLYDFTPMNSFSGDSLILMYESHFPNNSINNSELIKKKDFPRQGKGQRARQRKISWNKYEQRRKPREKLLNLRGTQLKLRKSLPQPSYYLSESFLKICSIQYSF